MGPLNYKSQPTRILAWYWEHKLKLQHCIDLSEPMYEDNQDALADSIKFLIADTQDPRVEFWLDGIIDLMSEQHRFETGAVTPEADAYEYSVIREQIADHLSQTYDFNRFGDGWFLDAVEDAYVLHTKGAYMVERLKKTRRSIRSKYAHRTSL